MDTMRTADVCYLCPYCSKFTARLASGRQAKNAMVQRNLRLVVSICKKFVVGGWSTRCLSLAWFDCELCRVLIVTLHCQCFVPLYRGPAWSLPSLPACLHWFWHLTHHTAVVISQGRGMQLSDLVSEGIAGLLKGVEKFDGSKGFKFSTYAHWWIRQVRHRLLAVEVPSSVCMLTQRALHFLLTQPSPSL